MWTPRKMTVSAIFTPDFLFSSICCLDKECHLCKRSEGNVIKCSGLRCKTFAHVTCASMSGFLFVVGYWPEVLMTFCLHRHTKRRNELLMGSKCANSGDKVLYITQQSLVPAIISQRQERVTLQIRFVGSSTTCSDFELKDVIDPNPVIARPTPGQHIRVLWSDDHGTTAEEAVCQQVFCSYSLELKLLPTGERESNISPGQVVPFYSFFDDFK